MEDGNEKDGIPDSQYETQPMCGIAKEQNSEQGGHRGEPPKGIGHPIVRRTGKIAEGIDFDGKAKDEHHGDEQYRRLPPREHKPAEGGEAKAVLTCVSHTVELTRSNPDVRSDESQKLRDGDRFFRHAGSMASRKVYWGNAPT